MNIYGSPQWQQLIAGLATKTGNLSQFAATTSAQLAGVISDETGTGALVFATSPGFTTAANPVSSDGATLGTTALQWSDLFLAEGGVINWDNGDVTVTQSGNTLTVAGGNLVFPGTATNDSAAAGNVGEYVSSSVAQGSAVSLTSGIPANVTSISLTAGDWDVTGSIAVVFSVSGAGTDIIGGINTTSAALPTVETNRAQLRGVTINATNPPVLAIAPVRLSLTATTTVYLIGFGVFSSGTGGGFGHIAARRMR